MPSKAILEQKQQVVSDLSEQIRNSVSGVIVNYQGITVDDDTKMRKPHHHGMPANAVSENDAVAPAKILKEYADKIDSFKLLAGFVDGEVLDEAQIIELAKTPSKEVLVSKLLGSLLSPLYKLAFVLDAASKKDAEAAEAPAEA